MQPHDELLHYGVKGMRWGVVSKVATTVGEHNAGKRAEANKRDAKVAKASLAKASELRSRKDKGIKGILNRNRARSAEDKAERYEMAKAHREAKQLLKGTMGLSKEKRLARTQALAKYNTKMHTAAQKAADRARNAKGATAWDKARAENKDYAAMASKYNAKVYTRKAQAKMGKKVSDFSKDENLYYTAEMWKAVASMY